MDIWWLIDNDTLESVRDFLDEYDPDLLDDLDSGTHETEAIPRDFMAKGADETVLLLARTITENMIVYTHLRNGDPVHLCEICHQFHAGQDEIVHEAGCAVDISLKLIAAAQPTPAAERPAGQE